MFKVIESVLEMNGWGKVKEYTNYAQFQKNYITVIIPIFSEYTDSELDTIRKKTGLCIK